MQPGESLDEMQNDLDMFLEAYDRERPSPRIRLWRIGHPNPSSKRGSRKPRSCSINRIAVPVALIRPISPSYLDSPRRSVP